MENLLYVSFRKRMLAEHVMIRDTRDDVFIGPMTMISDVVISSVGG
jgi:hypothetical protein